MGLLLLAVVGGYFAVLMGLGFLSRRASSVDEYLLAGKRLSYPVLVASIVATFYGATAVLGGAELSYYFGLGALWFMVPFYLGNLLLLFFLDKIGKSGAKTLPDYLGRFYGGRVVVAASLLLSLLCLVPASIIAAGKIMHMIHPISPTIWMALVSAVVVVYTILGGMRSVSYSDVIQFVLMLAVLVLLLPFAVKSSPDFLSNIPAENLSPLSYFNMLPQDAIRWTILLLFLPMTSAPLYQRFFSTLPSVSKKKAMVWSVAAYLVVDVILLATGMIAFANTAGLGIDETNADVAVVRLGLAVLPDFLKAFFAIGLLAAIMSTADSWLHAGASSLAYDVLGKAKKMSEREMVSASRVFVALLGAMSLALALYFKDIIAALTFLLTVWISGILIPTLTALKGIRIKEKSALASIFAGGVSSVYWGLATPYPVDPLFVGLGASILSVLACERFLK